MKTPMMPIVLVASLWNCAKPTKAEEPALMASESVASDSVSESTSAEKVHEEATAAEEVTPSLEGMNTGQPFDPSDPYNGMADGPMVETQPLGSGMNEWDKTPDANGNRQEWPPLGISPAKKWPFYKWDSARAVLYNLNEEHDAISLHSWSPKFGLNPSAHLQPELTQAQAKSALKLLAATQGALNVSKCAFPRHGIVFYSKGVPIGSIDLCFECGDILIYPPYRQAPDWQDTKIKMYDKLLKRYDKVFPKWKKFFGGELGLAPDWKEISQKLRSP
ncbi:MAG: hypothetical protein JKY56_07145 [Kofleriaceae bacterium]|nr:hypothetical protein [Kofleriaceae bacterium]